MAVRIHIYLFLVLTYMFAIGKLEIFICMYFFTLLHELAHMIVATFLSVNVCAIELLPIGVCAKYEKKPTILKELFVSLAGPLFSVALSFLFENVTFKMMNLVLAIFNLMPIKPFDGGKIIDATLKIILKEKTANKITNIFEKIFLNMMLILAIFLTIFTSNYYFIILIIYVICIARESAQHIRFNAAINYLQMD